MPELIAPAAGWHTAWLEATWALGRMLDQARALGLDRVLIVCQADHQRAEGIDDHGHIVVNEDRLTTICPRSRSTR
jgi:hypothetical protein